VRRVCSFAQRFMSFVQACPVAFRWITWLTFAVHHIRRPRGLNSPQRLQQARAPALGEMYLCHRPCHRRGHNAHDRCPGLVAPCPTRTSPNVHTQGSIWSRRQNLRCYVRCLDWDGAGPPFRFGKVPCPDSIVLRYVAFHGQNPFALSHFLSNTTTLAIMYLDFAHQMVRRSAYSDHFPLGSLVIFFVFQIWIKPEGPKHLSTIFGNLRYVTFFNIFYECDLNWTMFVFFWRNSRSRSSYWKYNINKGRK
jgi:hypothetical protein